MPNEWAPPPPPKPKRRWPRRLAWSAVIFGVLLISTYLALTSFTFVRLFVLPKVRESVNGPVEIAEGRVSAFWGVRLRGVKLGGTPFEEPLATLRELGLKLSLWDLFGGRIHLREVWIDTPVLSIIDYGDGTSNLDRFLKPVPSAPTSPVSDTPSAGPSAIPQILLVRGSLSNGVVRQVRLLPGGGRETKQIQALQFSLSNVGNSRTGTLRLGGEVSLDSPADTRDTNALAGAIQGALAAGFEVGLSDLLQLETVHGNLNAEVRESTLGFRELKGTSIDLHCDLTPSELKQLKLAVSRKGAQLGVLAVNGLLDLRKMEGDLRIDLSGIDRQALNLLTAPMGLDFTSTKLSSSHRLLLATGGQSVHAVGDFRLSDLSVESGGSVTKPLALTCNYDLTLNRIEQSLLVQQLSIVGNQPQGLALATSLGEPMKLFWGTTTNGSPDSEFGLSVTNLNLADWSTFVGPSQGMLDLRLRVLARQAGRQLSFDLAVAGQGLTVAVATNAPPRADLRLQLRGRVEDQRVVQVEECVMELLDQKQPFVIAKTTGHYNWISEEADARSEWKLQLPIAFRWLDRPDLRCSAGDLGIETRLTQGKRAPDPTHASPPSQELIIGARLTGLTGVLAGYSLDRFEAGFDLEAGAKGAEIELRKGQGSLRHAGQAGGDFELVGKVRPRDMTADATLRISGVNHHLLQPFLAPILGARRLTSASIDLTATARTPSTNSCEFSGRLGVAELLIADPAGALPKVPLTTEVRFSGSLRPGLAELREFEGTIRQGERAGGGFQANGRYDLSDQTTRLTGKLLDLNEHVLRPFVGAALGEVALESVSLGLDATALYQPKAESSASVELKLTHLLLRDPRGRIPGLPFDLELSGQSVMNGEEVTLQRMNSRLRVADQPAGSVSLVGGGNIRQLSGNLTMKLTDLNEHALKPFLPATTAGKQLASISCSADLNAARDGQGKVSVSGGLGVSRLVLQDSQAKQVEAPLGADLRLNGSFANRLLTLDGAELKLLATARAKNTLQLTGWVELARSDRFSGLMQLNAESLDLTAYADALRASPTRIETNATVSGTGGTSEASLAEPAAVTLPFADFRFGLNVGQLFLGDLAVRDWNAAVKLSERVVVVRPLQLTLNGAPVNGRAEIDLGQAGYHYDIGLGVSQLALGPLVDAFEPEWRGQYQGSLFLDSRLKGAGITGRNLRANLGGQVVLLCTNADLRLASPRAKALFAPIGLALGMPELLNAPLKSLGMMADIGEGRIKVTGVEATSQSFRVDTQGEIKLTDATAESVVERWPVHLAVPRAVADRLRLTPRDAPAGEALVRLPDFINLVGTLGSPKIELNKAALGGALAEKLLDRSVGGKPNPIGSGPGELLKKPGL